MAGASTIGIAGLGLVGSALAARLVASGYTVLGVDPNPARGALLDTARPGSSRDSVAQLAGECDCLMIAVFDDAQLRAVVAGFVAAWPRRASLALCITTAHPATLVECGRQCAAIGVAFVEAPISGSSAKIAAGEGRMFVGGSAAIIRTLRALVRPDPPLPRTRLKRRTA